MHEKLRRFVRNYGEMCRSLFITQGPGQWQAYTNNFNFTYKRTFNVEQNIAKKLQFYLYVEQLINGNETPV